MRTVETVDYHTGGEPFRIVPHPDVDLPGRTVAERRQRAITDPTVDRLRQLLCYEPRGHADMYGGFLVPPDDAGAHLGVLFWHKDGFSTACGHGTIALGAWAVHSGLVDAPDNGQVDVVIDVPSGRVRARVQLQGGAVVAVDFVNVASWLIANSLPVNTSRGAVDVAVSFGGAIYAQLPTSDVGLAVTPEQLPDLIAIGREIKWLLHDHDVARHPHDERLSGIYGTILYEDLGTDPDGCLHQRNVTIFADGEVDRSPCGSGTCARLATLSATGQLSADAELIHHSIVGSTFRARVVRSVGGTVIPQVTGMAYRTGTATFLIDPADPLVPGFVFR